MKNVLCSLCILALLNTAALAQEPNWNQFRGPNSDNHSASTGIAKSWGPDGPKLLWRIDDLGIGFSTVSIWGDKLFTMADVGDQCFVFAINRLTGDEIWRSAIGRGGDGGGRYPGPLGTPATDGQTVFAMSQFSDFVALDINTGTVKWRKNTQHGLDGAKMANWGYAMSPIIDGDQVLLPVGGEGGTLAAFSKTGELLWRTAWLQNPAAYTSVVPVEIGGVRQYLLLTGQLLAGVSPNGEFLWGNLFPGQTAVCSDPVLNGDVIMASCHYGVGAYFYRIAKDGNEFNASSFRGDGENLASHHGGIVAVGNHFYLLTNNNLSCVNAQTGETVWTDRSVGKGSLTYVDGVLILRSEGRDGTIAMVEASPEGYKELGRFDQPDRSDRQSWPYPVVFGNKLYIRDQGLLLCYDLN